MAAPALVPFTDDPTPEERQAVLDELRQLRQQDATLQRLIDRSEGIGREKLEIALENVRARRAYLAWVIDENDDRELGREILLPEPAAPSGPSLGSTT
jgi:hypothetical protein